jgi:hypothetical protein
MTIFGETANCWQQCKNASLQLIAEMNNTQPVDSVFILLDDQQDYENRTNQLAYQQEKLRQVSFQQNTTRLTIFTMFSTGSVDAHIEGTTKLRERTIATDRS